MPCGYDDRGKHRRAKLGRGKRKQLSVQGLFQNRLQRGALQGPERSTSGLDTLAFGFYTCVRSVAGAVSVRAGSPAKALLPISNLDRAAQFLLGGQPPARRVRREDPGVKAAELDLVILGINNGLPVTQAAGTEGRVAIPRRAVRGDVGTSACWRVPQQRELCEAVLHFRGGSAREDVLLRAGGASGCRHHDGERGSYACGRGMRCAKISRVYILVSPATCSNFVCHVIGTRQPHG